MMSSAWTSFCCFSRRSSRNARSSSRSTINDFSNSFNSRMRALFVAACSFIIFSRFCKASQEFCSSIFSFCKTSPASFNDSASRRSAGWTLSVNSRIFNSRCSKSTMRVALIFAKSKPLSSCLRIETMCVTFSSLRSASSRSRETALSFFFNESSSVLNASLTALCFSNSSCSRRTYSRRASMSIRSDSAAATAWRAFAYSFSTRSKPSKSSFSLRFAFSSRFLTSIAAFFTVSARASNASLASLTASMALFSHALRRSVSFFVLPLGELALAS
mmetsp:Transcript_4592/g.14899  ORF Transcript_4592/g.14899 Transcript_4592/m.14899 type:complete len:274 (+) Transcript_4592:464-1285(+)